MTKRYIRKPTEYEEQTSLLFAHNCAMTNQVEYARRNQDALDKLVQDIYYGKLAEILVHCYFIEHKKICTPPDLMIYPPQYKSFDANLVCNGMNIHVKSCIASDKWGNSWCFQPKDLLTIEPKDNEWLALVVFGKLNYFRLVRADAVTYGVPRKRGLNKKVIYEQNIFSDKKLCLP